MSNALAKTDNVTALDTVPHRTHVPTARLPLPTMQEIEALQHYATIVMKSGMAPSHFKNPEAVLVTMRYGHQLGIDEFTALQNMFVIGGKPSMMASLMHGLILRDHGPNAIRIQQQDDKACVLLCQPKGSASMTQISFTMAEADKAGLPAKNQNWKIYPSDMLFSRAVSRAARRVFRDTTLGMYTPEELDVPVVEVDGEIIGSVMIEENERPVPTEHPRAIQSESTASVSDVSEDFDDRLYDAIEMPKAAGKKAMDTLWKEAVAEKDADKIRKLITVVPDFDMAKWMLQTAADKYDINTPPMIAALADRPDNPEAAEEGEFAVVED